MAKHHEWARSALLSWVSRSRSVMRAGPNTRRNTKKTPEKTTRRRGRFETNAREPGKELLLFSMQLLISICHRLPWLSRARPVCTFVSMESTWKIEIQWAGKKGGGRNYIEGQRPRRCPWFVGHPTQPFWPYRFLLECNVGPLVVLCGVFQSAV